MSGAAPNAASAVQNALAYLRCVGRLKHLSRQGWVERGVRPSPPEPVGAHMWRMGVITMLCPKETGLDRDRMVRMCLVHDVCETIVGDVTPAMGVNKAEKAAAEMRAVQQVLAPLLSADAGGELAALFAEYEDNTTPEANFVHDIDLLDMVIQGLDYQISTPEADLSCFMTAAAKIRHPWARALADHVVAIFNGKEAGAPVPPPQYLGEKVTVDARKKADDAAAAAAAAETGEGGAK